MPLELERKDINGECLRIRADDVRGLWVAEFSIGRAELSMQFDQRTIDRTVPVKTRQEFLTAVMWHALAGETYPYRTVDEENLNHIADHIGAIMRKELQHRMWAASINSKPRP